MDKLENARGETFLLKRATSDIELLKVIYKELLNLEHMQTPNRGIISRKTNSRELIRSVREEIEKKQLSLLNNLDKELSEVPLIREDLYEIARNHFSAHHDIVREYYNGKIPSFVKDSKKDAIRIVQITSKKIVTSKNKKSGSYRVLIGYTEDKSGKRIPEYQYFNNILDATQFIRKQELNEQNKKIISQINAPMKTQGNTSKNIDEDFEEILNYSMSKYKVILGQVEMNYSNSNNNAINNLKSIISKIEQLYTKYYSYEKSIEKFDRIIDILSTNMHNGKKNEIIDKMKKEKILFREQMKELKKQINALDKIIEKEIKKIEEEEKNRQDSVNNSKQPKTNTTRKIPSTSKKPIRETSTNKKVELSSTKSDKKESIRELKELKEELLENDKKTILSIETHSSKEEKEMYEKYKKYREELDTLFEQKNNYNEERFKYEVARNMSIYGLGTTYEEVMDNMKNMRESLSVTKVIDKIISELKTEYTSIEEMQEIDSNGLSNLENRIIGRLISTIANNPDIPLELRSEIDYYIKRHQKLENEISYINHNRQGFSRKNYEIILNDNRIRLLVNTQLIEEVGLTNEVKRGK